METQQICECGCGEAAEIRKGTTCRYRRYNKGHYAKNGDRYRAEKALGHKIPKGAEVHHHGIPDEDTPNRFKDTTQLVLCEDRKYHRFLHMRQRKYFNVGVFRYNI
ncbi:MAG: hypothetical protein ABIL06_13065 [Pseudomonadota bacterium]